MTPVVVVGLMGSGKSTLARSLGLALGRPVRDSDVDLERTTGFTARQIQQRHGRHALHRLELEHLSESIEDPKAIVAAAASVVDAPTTPAMLADTLVVWIRGRPLDLQGRAATGAHRPLGESVLDTLRTQDRTRRPILADVADVVVEATLAPDEMVATVLDQIRGSVAGFEPDNPAGGDLFE